MPERDFAKTKRVLWILLQWDSLNNMGFSMQWLVIMKAISVA